MTVTDSLVGHSGNAGLAGLRSSKSVQRLEQVANLRSRGIGDNIDLPQLVVCGDQSAGNSSVLEGLTEIPFPRDDGVCTKFPTEVILEHADGPQTIVATLIPHASRSEASKATLKAFHKTIEEFSELPGIIAAAGALMGIRGYGSNLEGPAFAEDVLRIKVTVAAGLHLSIVDLPGLVSVASEVQTEDDISMVQRMVDSYIEKPRTIILAVTQASNDIANQSIIKKSKKFDKAGQRTVGVITKPDLINDGSQAKLALLAKNLDTTRLKLGFFLLKNPTPNEMKEGITAAQRSANELRFFNSSPWKEQRLETERVGIDKLKEYLQTLLDRHIEQELPKVRDEIKAMIKSTELEVVRLPKERPTATHLRMYVTDLATQYYQLSLAALSGDYNTTYADFFADDGDGIGLCRLRAIVHKANTEFAQYMRKKGRKLHLVEKPAQGSNSQNGTSTSQRSQKDASETPEMDLAFEFQQEFVTKAELKAWVNKTYAKTRGRELPGNYNQTLLTELFHYQSQLWPIFAEAHLDEVHSKIYAFVQKTIEHLNIEDYVLREIEDRMAVKLEENKTKADEELARLVAEEKQHPITYNHYYTDNVQKSRLKAVKEMMEKTVQKVDTNTASFGGKAIILTPEALIASLHDKIIVDMDERACSEALVDLEAYYKVSRKTFVDNVCRQVIERHLLNNLPEIFSARSVAGYTDEELEQIAAERPEVIEKRKRLHEELKNLRAGLKALRL